MRSSELPDARAPGRDCHPLSKSAPARRMKRIGQPVTEPRKEPQVPNPSPLQQTTKLRIYSEALGERSSLSISEECSQEQRGSGDPKILALSSKVVLQNAPNLRARMPTEEACPSSGCTNISPVFSAGAHDVLSSVRDTVFLTTK